MISEKDPEQFVDVDSFSFMSVLVAGSAFALKGLKY